MNNSTSFAGFMSAGLIFLLAVGFLAHVISLFLGPEVMQFGTIVDGEEAYIGPPVAKWWMLMMWLLPVMAVYDFWVTTKGLEIAWRQGKPLRFFFRHGAAYAVLFVFVCTIFDIFFVREKTPTEYMSIGTASALSFGLLLGLILQIIDWIRVLMALSSQKHTKPGH